LPFYSYFEFFAVFKNSEISCIYSIISHGILDNVLRNTVCETLVFAVILHFVVTNDHAGTWRELHSYHHKQQKLICFMRMLESTVRWMC